MRKRIDPGMVTALLLVAAMSFVAWFTSDADTTSILGRYLQTDEGYHIVIDESGTPVVLTDRENTGIFNGLSAGDLIKLSCSVPEGAYPAHAVAYFCVRLERGTFEDLPLNTLNALVDLNWLSSLH